MPRRRSYDVVQRRNSGEFENIRDVVLRTLDSIELRQSSRDIYRSSDRISGS